MYDQAFGWSAVPMNTCRYFLIRIPSPANSRPIGCRLIRTKTRFESSQSNLPTRRLSAPGKNPNRSFRNDADIRSYFGTVLWFVMRIAFCDVISFSHAHTGKGRRRATKSFAKGNACVVLGDVYVDHESSTA